MATIETLRIGPPNHGRFMTLDEFRDAEETDGYRYELANGVLEVTEVPDDMHGQVITNLYDAISRFRRDHPGLIQRYGGGAEFRLWLPGMQSGRNPDLGVVFRGAARDKRGQQKPALVAEVVSIGGQKRDYVVKRQEYLVFGIEEYWIVDPQLCRVTVLGRNGDIWDERVFDGEQTIESTLLPGLALAVTDLWVDLPEDPTVPTL